MYANYKSINLIAVLVYFLVPYITHAFPILQRNWSKLAADLVDADNLDVDHQKLLKRLTRFYFKNTPPEKAPISTYAQVKDWDK